MVELLSYTPNADSLCAEAASICYDAKNPQAALETAMSGGHESVIEHACFTFKISDVSRVLLAQITRHRLASFSVQSQRYVDASNDASYIPKGIVGTTFQDLCEAHIKKSLAMYQTMVDDGIPKEDARYILPQSMTTKIIVTMNARELRHFLKLRCCNRAQKEIRDVADQMYRLAYPKAPIILRNAGPGCIRGKCQECHPCGKPRTAEELKGIVN